MFITFVLEECLGILMQIGYMIFLMEVGKYLNFRVEVRTVLKRLCIAWEKSFR